MSKCPYCARPLHMGGLKCRACRRYVLRREHVIILIIAAAAAAVLLMEVMGRMTPPHNFSDERNGPGTRKTPK